MPNTRILPTIAFLMLVLAPCIGGAAGIRNWNLLTPDGPKGPVTAAVFNGSIFAITKEATNAYWESGLIQQSPDGIHWMEKTQPWGWDAEDYQLIVFKGSLWAINSNATRNLEFWRTEDGDTWTRVRPPTIPGRRSQYALAVFNDKLWMSGGWDGSQALNEIWNSADGTSWTLVAKGSQVGWPARCKHGFAAYKDRLYVIGGVDDWSPSSYFSLDDVWTSTDGVNWTCIGQISPNRGGFSTATWDDKLWIFGGEEYFDYEDYGYDEYISGESSDSFLYSSDGKTWSSGVNDPIGRIQWQASVVLNNRIYIIGGARWIDDEFYGDGGDELIRLGDVWVTDDPNYAATAVNVPLKLVLPQRSGQTATVEVKNTGKLPWAGNSGFGLKVSSDPDKACAQNGMTTISTTVNPGETYKFKIPLDLSRLWTPTEIKFRMFQESVGQFGDVMTLSLDLLYDHPITWRQVSSENYHSCEQGDTAVSDQFFWLWNYRSANGLDWVELTDLDKNAPGYDEEYDENDFYGDVVFFRNKLMALEADFISKSSDGMNWNRSDAPWDDVDWSSESYSPEISSTCILDDRLYVMIHYDLNTWYDYEYKNVVWATSDGSNWSKLGEFNDLYDYGRMVAFKGRIWIYGGYHYFIDGQDGESGTYTDGQVYYSYNGKSWTKADLYSSVLDHIVVYDDKLWAIDGNRLNSQIIVSLDGMNGEPTNIISWANDSELSGLFVFKNKLYGFSEDGVWCGSTFNQSVTVPTSAMDFGRHEVMAGASPCQNVIVHNTGLSPLKFTGTGAEIISSRPGEFALNPAPKLAPVNVSRAIGVSFNPRRLGPTSATLQITTADAAQPTISVKLTGEGISNQPLKSGKILAYILGLSSESANLDQNADSKVDIADHVHILNSPIEVTTPTRSSTYDLGGNLPIRWSAKTTIGNVRLALARNHEPVKIITSSTPNDGAFDWTVSTDLVADDNYSIIVTDTDHTTIQGESKAFTLKSPGDTISVQYPGGGEAFKRGEKVPIHWVVPYDSDIEHIRVEIYKNDAPYKTLVSSRSIDDGEVYAWTVPTDFATGDTYRIVVMDADNRACRGSSARMFAISK